MGRDGDLIWWGMKVEVHPVRVVVKALCLFVALNILYALLDPQGLQISGYNVIFPGRTRLPFGVMGDPYSVAIENVDVTFASHRVSAPKGSNEFRVVLIGDSSLWGEDLGAYEVISEQWNKPHTRCGDKIIKAYNLGYPHPSVLKDLVILDKALEYQPDLILWFVTLNTLISQRINPFLMANPERAEKILNNYDIGFEQTETFEGESSFYERTLLGQRSELARQIRLEMLGIIWTATGQDNNRLTHRPAPDFGVTDNPSYRGLEPPQDISEMLLFDALQAGHQIAGTIPVLIVNEPIFVVPEERARVRYNAVYPRWAYDQYRKHIASQARHSGWDYLDLWDAVPPEYFTDARFHLNVEGEQLLIQQMNPALQSIVCEAQP
jgi:hypothetical protein